MAGGGSGRQKNICTSLWFWCLSSTPLLPTQVYPPTLEPLHLKWRFPFFFQVRAFLLQPPSPSLVLLLRLHIHAPAPAPVEHQSTAQVCCNPHFGAARVLCAVHFVLCSAIPTLVLHVPCAVSCAFCALCYILCAAIRCLVLCARWYVQQPPHGAAACSSAHLPIQSLTLAAVKCEILQVDIARTPANFLIASSS